MSTAPIITDLQKINPSAIIELFTLTTDATLHGSAQTYRFHNGTSLNANGDIIWAGNQYLKMPIQAEGFAFQKGQLPRPTLTISNALGTITAILLNVNQVTTGNDLTGATVTRIRTLARYIDAVNFPTTTTSTTTTTTIADPADAESVTYTVTVVNVGGSNIFAINGSNNPVLTMKRGSTYTFDVSDNTNATHPLRIKSDAGGDETVTVNGTQGTSGATVIYQPGYPTAPSDLRYYCSTHGNSMGNTITMNNPSTTTQDTTTITSQQVNPLGTPDPTAEFPQEIYKIDRKSSENREVVTFELAAVFDLAGIRAPKRQCTRTEFPSIGTFIA
tara:strand:+ start:185 stop:1177 length:993 start_codon:yes stop_codon:yes gene_type:complete